MTYRARCEGRVTRERLRRALDGERWVRYVRSGKWYEDRLRGLGIEPIVPWHPAPEYLDEHLPPLQAEIDRVLAEIAENSRKLVGAFVETR